MNAEKTRLEEARTKKAPWKKWGPYLSERQWGTVREDYSESGDAWNYFTHDHARSRAYRWGEDGLAGVSDDRQRLCFALALWNGNDPILKERLFGLTNSEGNHGEDVKEYYFYLDSTPTHSYMKYLYKYPQAAYPYDNLVATNRDRGRGKPEYELLDTGVFDQDRYFDVFVEYAKASPEDLLIRITVHNRGPEAATLHLLPTLWFRNDWSWGEAAVRPSMKQLAQNKSGGIVALKHRDLGDRFFFAEGASALLFTENETNMERLLGIPNPSPYVKDGIGNYHRSTGRRTRSTPRRRGRRSRPITRSRWRPEDPARSACGSATGRRGIPRARWAGSSARPSNPSSRPGSGKRTSSTRRSSRPRSTPIRPWSCARPWPGCSGPSSSSTTTSAGGSSSTASSRTRPNQRSIRNDRWGHMVNADVISMPDKWEYPWYAAWDLAFHVTALTLVDQDFGKDQLELFLSNRYFHPSGQIPAYEWNFGDVNPPVHAWSTIYTYLLEKGQRGQGDIAWLERCFHKLLLNFNWWVNRKDRTGNNAFEGGFLGLDNIGVFDRSSPLPTGGFLEQADGTAWMALFCQNMLEISAELALANPAYLDLAKKFFGHFLMIASGMVRPGEDGGMWDEEDGFFYDVLRSPDGRAERLKVRSMVGLLPLCAVTVFGGKLLKKYPEMGSPLAGYLEAHPELRAFIHDPGKPGHDGRLLASILNETNLRRVLSVMLDEKEFLSPFGIRALSRVHEEHPYVYRAGDAGIPGLVSPRRLGQRDVRRQFELARPDLDAGQHADPPRPAPVLPLLREFVHRRMPDGVGEADEPLRGGRGDRAPPVQRSS